MHTGKLLTGFSVCTQMYLKYNQSQYEDHDKDTEAHVKTAIEEE